ncbi:HD-GYP domain-containing protein [Bosea minatitlanensis]|uniref:HD-GYP domain-containing protein n=1 Tax=Bosea minatitlanensis TaxID=128782 RepID=A0ABW0EYD9_9HYPH|nr:HD domain-containing phosphohydrolase [Bosea minatitlanensis]MCT4495086.1 HD domain-containing protein [Bosea minatitlanensis]
MQRALSVWGACRSFDLAETDAIAAASGRILIVDLDLSDPATIGAARAALAPHRRGGTPFLFLLRDMSARCQMQANALGARVVLPAATAQPALLDRVGALLGLLQEAGPQAAQQRRFVRASAAFADLLEAAGSGDALPVQLIHDGVEAINRAAADADLDAWLDLVWRHDDATYQHCLLVSGLVAAFAHKLGFSEADRQLITGAAVLHDIGKARIPLDILRKEGPLTPEERAIICRHPQIGHDMLVAQGGFAPLVLDAVLSHHEMLDGSGYPRGIGAERISDPVRVITICDIYAALIERRSYKQPLPPGEAFAVLVGMGGKLDRDLVRVFGEVVLGTAVSRLGKVLGPAGPRDAERVA